MLTFNLKKEWFDKIKAGEKTHEYREVKPYWTKAFYGNITGMQIAFACGYPKVNDSEKRLYARVISMRIINGMQSDLKTCNLVYDIEFEVIK